MRTSALAMLSLAAIGALPSSARSQAVRDNLWIPDGPAKAITIANGLIYIGGSFSHVGPPAGSFVGLDRTSGAPLEPYPMVGGGQGFNFPSVTAIAPDGSGGWYIGGSFTTVADQPRRSLAHLDASGNLLPWNPGTNGQVRALAVNVNTGVVYVSGGFDSVGGQPRFRLAAIDAASGVPTSWDPHPLDTALPGNTGVGAIALNGNVVYVGGDFTTIGGQPRAYLAALDGTSGAASAWNPSPDAPVFCLAVRAIIVSPFTVTVYVGGNFANIGGQARNFLAAIDGSSGLATNWNPNPNHEVSVIALAGGSGITPLTIYVAGEFYMIGGQSRNALAAVDASGAVKSWDPNPGFGGNSIGTVSALAGGSPLYVGGFFSTIGGQPRSNIAAIDGTGAATSWNPGAGSGAIQALAATGSAVFAGGSFTTIGEVVRNNLAALDPATGAPTGWDPDANGEVDALTVAGGLFYAGGSFTTVGGLPRNHVAQIATDGGVGSWNPGPDGPAYALAARRNNFISNTIYMGGLFTNVMGQPRSCLAAVTDEASPQLTGWSPNASNTVRALTVSGSTIFAGGSFDSIGGQRLLGNLAALDLSGALIRSADSDGPIYALAVAGSLLRVGGNFNEMSFRQRTNLAVLDATTLFTNTWDPFTDDKVEALAVDGTTLYVGGQFSSIGFASRLGLGALDLTSGLVSGWNGNFAAAYASALAVANGAVYVGGGFGIGEVEHSGLVGLMDAVAGVVETGPSVRPQALRLSPNPFRGRLGLAFRLPAAAPCEVTIHDVTGRLVRRLERRDLAAGEQRVTWDGRDESGHGVGAGVYFVSVQAGSVSLAAKALRLE